MQLLQQLSVEDILWTSQPWALHPFTDSHHWLSEIKLGMHNSLLMFNMLHKILHRKDMSSVTAFITFLVSGSMKQNHP
jgi:uncharacterized membrane protein YfhO